MSGKDHLTDFRNTKIYGEEITVELLNVSHSLSDLDFATLASNLGLVTLDAAADIQSVSASIQSSLVRAISSGDFSAQFPAMSSSRQDALSALLSAHSASPSFPSLSSSNQSSQSEILSELDASESFPALSAGTQSSLLALLAVLDSQAGHPAISAGVQSSLAASLSQLNASAAFPAIQADTIDELDGDIIAVEVQPEGDSAVVTIKGWASYAGSISYDFGFDSNNAPTANSAAIASQKQGFSSINTANTTLQTSYVSNVRRQGGVVTLDEQANGSDLDITVALTKTVHQPDDIGTFFFPQGWANNGSEDSNASSGDATSISTWAYERVIPRTLNHDLDVCESNDYVFRIVAGHAHCQQGQAIRGLRVTATDESLNTVSVNVTQESRHYYAATGLWCSCYEATLPFSLLNAGEMVTITYTAYPFVGEEYDVGVHGNAYLSPNETIIKVLNDFDGSYGNSYAYVDGVGGGTPTASNDPSTAEANPFETVSAAAAAIQNYNNTNYSRNNLSGGVLRLEEGVHVHSSFSSLAVGQVPLIIESADPDNKDTTIYTDSGSSTSNSICDYLKLRNIKIRKTGGSVIFLDSSALAGSDNMLVAENVEWDINSTSVYGAWLYRVGRFWQINCTGDAGQSVEFSTAIKEGICFGCTEVSGRYATICCRSQIWKDAASNGREATIGTVLGWNFFTNRSVSGESCVRVDEQVGPEGIAMVGNIFEMASLDTGPALYVSADGNIENVQNVLDIANTIVGSRTNWMYQDVGSTYATKRGISRGSVHWKWNCKGHLFPTADAARTGNFSQLYHTDHEFLSYYDGDNNDNNVGSNQWMGENAPLNSKIRIVDSVIDPDWLQEESYQTTQAGQGDYRPGNNSELPKWDAGQTPFKYDLFGTEIPEDGTATIGSAQSAILAEIPVQPTHWWDFSDEGQVTVESEEITQVNDKQGSGVSIVFAPGERPELITYGNRNVAGFRGNARGTFSSQFNIDEDNHTFFVISNAQNAGTDNFFFAGLSYNFYWRALTEDHGLAFFDTGPKNSTTVLCPKTTQGEDPDIYGVYGMRSQYISSGSDGIELGDGITKDSTFAAAPVSNSEVLYYRARGDGNVLGMGNDICAFYFNRKLSSLEIDNLLKWAAYTYGPPCVQLNHRPVIVCDGDSLTDGYTAQSWEESTSYPAQLTSSFNLSGARIINNGIDGDRISNDTTAARTVAALAAHSSARKKIVLFFKGGNDAQIDGDSAATVISNMDAWISSVRTAEPDVIIVGATIPARGAGAIPASVSTINDHIRNTADFDFVSDLQAIPEMDEQTDTLNTDIYIFDQIHYTDRGHRLISNSYAQTLINNKVL